jgi:DNA repair protein RadD
MNSLFTPAQLATEKFQPRPYQAGAIKAGVNFFNSSKIYHGLEILPTGSGKSVVIANIAKELDGKTIVFQPSKEILEQNFAKFISYGYRASIYSASAGQKRIDKVTFATIGSVAKKHYLFKDFKNIIVDEAHLVNPQKGMYHDFIHAVEGCKVIGMTATPYRLTTSFEGAMLKFLTRTRPRIFSKVLYCVQKDVLFNAGYLAPLKYYSFNVIDRKMISLNKSGTDFDQRSLSNYYKKIDFPKATAYYANRILAKRNSLMIFCATVADAIKSKHLITGSELLTDETKSNDRSRIFSAFKANKIRCLIVVGIGTTGFDFPGLEAVLLASSMLSLSMYEQKIGRVMRPFTYADGSKKEGWIVDLGGNVNFFGKIETMQVVQNEKGLHSIMNNGRHLTNVTFEK